MRSLLITTVFLFATLTSLRAQMADTLRRYLLTPQVSEESKADAYCTQLVGINYRDTASFYAFVERWDSCPVKLNFVYTVYLFRKIEQQTISESDVIEFYNTSGYFWFWVDRNNNNDSIWDSPKHKAAVDWIRGFAQYLDSAQTSERSRPILLLVGKGEKAMYPELQRETNRYLRKHYSFYNPEPPSDMAHLSIGLEYLWPLGKAQSYYNRSNNVVIRLDLPFSDELLIGLQADVAMLKQNRPFYWNRFVTDTLYESNQFSFQLRSGYYKSLTPTLNYKFAFSVGISTLNAVLHLNEKGKKTDRDAAQTFIATLSSSLDYKIRRGYISLNASLRWARYDWSPALQHTIGQWQATTGILIGI